MADIDTVRLLIGDREKAAVNENFGEGDGANLRFQLSMSPLIEPATGVLEIFLTGSTAATNTYVISGAVGNITFSVGNAPANGATMLASYRYVALTTGELTDILSGHTGQPYLAAANAALILAADASRYFAYTMGDKTIDKRRVSESFRELSKELENKHYAITSKNNYGMAWSQYDDSGTVYDGYDTAVATLSTSTA